MKLATYDQAIDYFKKLAASSPCSEAGGSRADDPGPDRLFRPASRAPRTWPGSTASARSPGGWPIPEGLTDDEARALAREGKAFVHIDGGCHATEVAGAADDPPAGLRPDHAVRTIPRSGRSSRTSSSCSGRR